jgi:hypothetical protein
MSRYYRRRGWWKKNVKADDADGGNGEKGRCG